VLVAASAMVFVAVPLIPVVEADGVRHLLDVLRLRAGEPVVAADGAGRWVPCRVTADATAQGSRRIDGDRVLVPDGPMVTVGRPQPEVAVAFAPTKGDRPEWVTQKLTELGVDRIIPLVTSRSVVRWEGERAAKSTERLRRVAREAAAQSRRVWLPDVMDVCRLDDLSGLVGGTPVALADAGGAAPGLDRPVVAIGPEGGWDDAERAAFGPGVGLGPNVLRAETAAVVAGAFLCGLRGGVVLPLA
jgi:16S rRNA (uracil1498-N3)-methyltransferase